MNIFDQLAALHLKVKVTDQRPSQWIYAVDDAWFQPDGWNLTITKNNGEHKVCPPLFDNDNQLMGKPLVVGTDSFFASAGPAPASRETALSGARQSDAKVDPSLQRFKKCLDRTDWHNSDDDTARRLVTFIQQRSTEGLDYGVCFCSFEFFWRHIEEIDQPQNAVFFDIRHQLADPSAVVAEDKKADRDALRDSWQKTELPKTDLFSGAGYEMTRLGWYLHYAMKFAKIPKMTRGVPHIDGNHIQIVSSAINPQTGDTASVASGAPTVQSSPSSAAPSAPGHLVRNDAMSDYTQVQKEIWKTWQDKKGGGTSLASLTPDRFTFSPIPKGAALDTGLEIFNNSFKKAANWDAIRNLLLDDLLLLWNEANNAHDITDNFDKLKGRLQRYNWVHGVHAQGTGLRGIYHYYCTPQGNECVAAESMVAFLRLACPGTSPNLPTNTNGWKLIFPTNPGISYLIGIADLYQAMCNLENHNDRSRPVISIDRYNDGSEGLAVVFSLRESKDVASLQKIAAADDKLIDKKAKGAIQRVYRGAQVLRWHLSQAQNDPSAQKYHNGNGNNCCKDSVRARILEQHYCAKLTDHVVFVNTQIQFKFAKKP